MIRMILLCVAFLLAPACGNNKAAAGKTVDVAKLLGAAPKDTLPQKGGTFVWGRGSDSLKLDPAAVTDGESVQVITNIFDTLVAYRPGTTGIMPWLATEWSTTVDQLAWTFSLRKDVKFHDGSPFNAHAVVFSFQRQQMENHPARRADDTFPYFHDNFKALQSVEAVDDFTVQFLLKRPYAPFLSALALFSTAIVCPNAFEQSGKDENGRYKYNLSEHPIGTGPFVFKLWERDSRIVLLSNPDHFAGAPAIEKLIFKPILNPHARLKELQSGGLDGMNTPALEDLASIHNDKRLRLLARPGLNVCYLAMNTLKKPFHDKRVRQAVAFAINKKRLIESAYNGMAEPAIMMLPSSMAGYRKRVDRKFNPKRARALLAEAGYADGFETTLWHMANDRAYIPNPGNTAIQIQQDLKEIGITVKLKKLDWSAYSPAVQNGEHDMCLLGWMADINDPDNFLYVLLDKENAVKGQAQNVSFYQSERVHRLLMKAQRVYDMDKRIEAYHEAQEIVFEECPVVPLATVPDFKAVRREVRGYNIYPAGGEYFRQISFGK